MRHTNWCAVTGAPCSGKTTVIREFERLGYNVVHEVARAYIDGELGKGKTIRQIKADIRAFEQHILNEKIAIEASLSSGETFFLDRAVPDSIAYFILEGLDPDEPLKKSKITRYAKIFFFERLRFEKDAVRSEDDTVATELDRLLQESYQLLGYEIIRVPLMPVRDRVAFMLSHLQPG
ncbi:MAG: ATP-binding protein [Pseudomonadota bacterium]